MDPRPAPGPTVPEGEDTPSASTGGSPSHRVWAAVVPLALSLAVLWILDPALWFRSTIPALTDLTGHLLPPSILRGDLLPALHLQGWSPDWFAGFPVYRFYFPLPGLLVAGLGGVLGDALALRLVAMLPLVLLPWALWRFGRDAGLGSIKTAGVTLAGTTSVVMVSGTDLGGNVFSVVTGEFSYAWSLLFVVLYLGRASMGRRADDPVEEPGPVPIGRFRTVSAGVLLAAATLSHLVPVMVVTLGMVPVLVTAGPRHRRAILGGWVLAGLLSAFWMLPMAGSLDQVGSMRWAVVPGLSEVVPLELVPLLLPAAFGLVLLRRSPALAMLAGAGGAALLLTAVPQGLVMRGRSLPVWYLAVHVLAGAGLAHALTARARGTVGRWGIGLVAVLGTLGLLASLATRRVGSHQWESAMAGLDARPGAPEFQATIETLSTLPPGRVYWEPGDLGRFGGSFAFALLPYWTDHTTLGGLWNESTPTSEFVPLVDRMLEPGVHVDRDLPPTEASPRGALDRLRMLGVRYLITHSAGTAGAIRDIVGSPEAVHGALQVFDLGPAPLVTTLPCWSPPPSGMSVREAGPEWFVAWRPGSPHLVDRRTSVSDGGAGECVTPEPGRDAVDGIVLDDGGTIRFRAAAPGIPHLVRISYFPAWRARGADGPYPAGPWFMVVVPRQEEVTLTYAVDLPRRLGSLITLATLVGLAGWAAAGRSPTRRSPGTGDEGGAGSR